MRAASIYEPQYGEKIMLYISPYEEPVAARYLTHVRDYHNDCYYFALEVEGRPICVRMLETRLDNMNDLPCRFAICAKLMPREYLDMIALPSFNILSCNALQEFL